jgi:hypothetical protein
LEIELRFPVLRQASNPDVTIGIHPDITTRQPVAGESLGCRIFFLILSTPEREAPRRRRENAHYWTFRSIYEARQIP